MKIEKYIEIILNALISLYRQGLNTASKLRKKKNFVETFLENKKVPESMRIFTVNFLMKLPQEFHKGLIDEKMLIKYSENLISEKINSFIIKDEEKQEENSIEYDYITDKEFTKTPNHKPSPEIPIVKESTIDNIDVNVTSEKEDWVGIIIQNNAKKLTQGVKGGNEVIHIEGWLYDHSCHLAVHKSYFIAQHPNQPEGHKRKVVIQLKDFKNWPENSAHESSDDPRHALRTSCEFHVIRFLEPDEFGSTMFRPIHGSAMSRYKIRKLQPSEYLFLNELPNNGIPLGIILHDSDITKVTGLNPNYALNFPVHNEEYEQLLFNPLFAIGRPGSGKTNSLKTIIAAANSCQDYYSGYRPKFIIFDIERQFIGLAKTNNLASNLTDEDKKLHTKLGINPLNCSDVEVISKQSLGNKTFSFKELLVGYDTSEQIRIIKLFLRPISEATEIYFDAIAEYILDTFVIDSFSDFQDAFFEELEDQTQMITQSLNSIQNKVLRTALMGKVQRFFDETNPIDLRQTIIEKEVVIFDFKGLSQELVIFYVLVMLEKLKIDQRSLNESIICVFDEAHRIFKNKNGSSTEARYAKMISNYLINFSSRGRKYRLGMWLASQRPNDLHKDISSVIETHLIFGQSKNNRQWLMKHIGDKEIVNIAIEMKNHLAFFINTNLARGRAHLLKMIKSPNTHETFV